MGLLVRVKLFVRRQMVSLWGSRGLVFRVAELAKSNVLATTLYLMSSLAPIVLAASFRFGPDILNYLTFSTSLLISFLTSTLFLVVSLYLFSRPVSISEFLRGFFAAFLTIGIFSLVSTMPIMVLPDALNFHFSALRDVLLAAYMACLFARVALSEPFSFEVPSKIFIGILFMVAGIHMVDLGVGHFVTGQAAHMFLAAIAAVLSVPVFLAAIIALRRHGLKDDGDM